MNPSSDSCFLPRFGEQSPTSSPSKVSLPIRDCLLVASFLTHAPLKHVKGGVHMSFSGWVCAAALQGMPLIPLKVEAKKEDAARNKLCLHLCSFIW